MCVFARFVLAQLRAIRASSTAKRKGLATQLLGFGFAAARPITSDGL
jgi:hypothetical protein